jgi:nucleophosmin 1
MYWADKITQSKPIKSQKLFEGGEFSVVHLSNAIVENAGDARVKLVGKLGKGDDITLASLTKGSDTAKLDFYINCTQQVTLSVHGGSDKTEVHLSGYFEPNGEDQDDDMFYGEEAEEGEEDLEDEDSEEEPKKASLTESLKQAKINSNKNASAKVIASESDEESEIEDDDDESEDIPVVVKKPVPAAPTKPV